MIYTPPTTPNEGASVSWMVLPTGANGVDANDVVSGEGSLCRGAFPLSYNDVSPVMATLDCQVSDLPSGSTVDIWIAEDMGDQNGPQLITPPQSFTYPVDFPETDEVHAAAAGLGGFQLSFDVDHPSSDGLVYWYVGSDVTNLITPSLEQMRTGQGSVCAGSLAQPVPAVYTTVDLDCAGLRLGTTYNVWAAVDSDGLGMAMSWGNSGRGFPFTTGSGITPTPPTDICIEGLEWDTNTCYPKSCIGGKVAVKSVTCPETDGVPCNGGRYVPNSDGCCSVCTQDQRPQNNWAYGMACDRLPPQWCTSNPSCIMLEEMECEYIDCEIVMNPQQCAAIPHCFWYGFGFGGGEETACNTWNSESMGEYYEAYQEYQSELHPQYLQKNTDAWCDRGKGSFLSFQRKVLR
eukprot:TRINITY_DN924_c0_g1_i1.p1 TRINITY_DN924_c0_g1~~TRINITY_DN924_c0_g1_i1.p1  ORF type:complete len:404 (-),score=65.54 TRINITY_DN924_c0_g1_i1:611-1822(-)